MSSVHNVDGELPETLGSIKSVTDSQEAVMSFYYTDAANQVGFSSSGFVGKLVTCLILHMFVPGQGDGDLRRDSD